MKPLATLIASLAALAIAAAPASAEVFVDGSGEPQFTNSTQNTQWYRWTSPAGVEAYRLVFKYYRDDVLVKEVKHDLGKQGSGWVDWAGVATLQEGSRYAICVSGEFRFHGDTLWWPEGGDNSCASAAAQGKRAHTTIDRTKPTIAVTLAGGAAATKSAALPLQVDFQDNLAGPHPHNFVCVKAGATPCENGFVYSPACSVPAKPGKAATFNCTVEPPSLPDGPVTVCAIAADGALPDNPTSSDQSGSASAANLSAAKCDTVTLDRGAPSAGISASKAEPLVGESIAFTAQASDAGTGIDAASQRWQWGDGTADATGVAAGHSFASPGTYLVKFRVRDAAGNETVAEKSIVVKAPPAPKPDEPQPDQPQPGQPKPDEPQPDFPKPDQPKPDQPKPDAPDTTAIEKDIVKAAGEAAIARTQVGSVTVIAPRRFRLGKAKHVLLGVRSDQAGELTLTLVRGKKTHSRLTVGVAPGATRQKLKLPKSVKPGTYSLKIAFKPSGASWSASGSAKIAFLKAKKR